MREKIFLEQTAQEMLNIVEALQFYKDNAVKPKYKNLIDEQLMEIGKQLQLQNINIFIKDYEQEFKFGQVIEYENEEAVIVGNSDEDNFIKIAISTDNKIEVIDVPLVLIKKRC